MNAATRIFSTSAGSVTAHAAVCPDACGRGTAQFRTPARRTPRATAATA